MRVLVVGHGGREHAIVKKLTEENVDIYTVMGRSNPGIVDLSKTFDIIDINNPKEYNFNSIDIAFIGPESPLAAGVSDQLTKLEIPVVGPTKAAAKLEWSKSFTRKLLKKYEIQGNPEYKICKNMKDVNGFLDNNSEVAVKPDVLTGGKGVKITGEHLLSNKDVRKYAAKRIKDDGLVILEERLKGREFTLQTFTDGKRIEIMPLVRDYKRAYDGNKGPNTGSMGSFSCPDHVLPDLSNRVVDTGIKIMKKTISAIAEEADAFKGILYGGFMNTEKGVYLLEYNVRFGDPEAINVLSILETPLTKIGFSIIEGNLTSPDFQNKATVCVYLVPNGYPINPTKDKKIEIKNISNSEIHYASVYLDKGQIKTTGSRAIALLSKGKTVSEAREKVYQDVPSIEGDLFYRTDIAKGV